MDGPFKIPADLSAAITQNIDEMEYLYNEDKMITLPIHVLGEGNKPPTINVLKIAEDIFKNAIRNKGKEALGDVLKKVLGEEALPQEQQTGAEAETGKTDAGQTGEPGQEETPSLEDQLIEKGMGILDQIFK